MPYANEGEHKGKAAQVNRNAGWKRLSGMVMVLGSVLLLQACGTFGGDVSKQMSDEQVTTALQKGKAVVITQLLGDVDNTWRLLGAPDDARGRLELLSGPNSKVSELIAGNSYKISVVEPGTYVYKYYVWAQDANPIQFNETTATNLFSPLGAIHYENTSRTYQEPYTVQVWFPEEGYTQYPPIGPNNTPIPVYTKTRDAGYYPQTRYRPRTVSVVKMTVFPPTIDNEQHAYIASFEVKPGEIVLLDTLTLAQKAATPDAKRCKALDNASWACSVSELYVGHKPYQLMQADFKEKIKKNRWSEALVNRIAGRSIKPGPYMQAGTKTPQQGWDSYQISADALQSPRSEAQPRAKRSK